MSQKKKFNDGEQISKGGRDMHTYTLDHQIHSLNNIRTKYLGAGRKKLRSSEVKRASARAI
jgi:hypothetical protein